ncbi:phage tail tape measure protein [Cellulosimicrobium cellulans]|uniref:phage tail tape measure protein n=1 Tax=Cellulosimicrobium cellulans TaxID=1710 RepID=UPI0019647DA1|nr:phage tail tape measure protein [Cellulosimicrobium cellulans]MBN0039390.1 phage tail tape measure protein [Cellulosimicrobium cellulans]
MALRAGELEFLFKADTKPVEKAEKDVKQIGQRIERNPAKVKVDADVKGALAGMDQVEADAKKLVSQDVVTRIEADISQAEQQSEKIRSELEYLNSVKGELQVDADIQRAEGKLERVERTLQGLRSARATMEVDADTAAAESELDDLADDAGDAGAEGGRKAGAGLADGIVAALATVPIAGAVVGIGVAAGKALADAIQDGLGVEQRQDRLQALTGISEGEAAKLGRAAGEAYADTFGESIESNMDTARIAVQQGLLDPKATTRQAQQVISSLAGIADVLDEDVRPVSVAVTQLLRTGLVKSADEAFDLLATGAREGVNAQEDLLDTFTEYPSLFQRLGLSGEEALGLINQGLAAGARNSDLAADALKEFQIRATDGSKASAEGYQLIGLSAEEMTAKIAAGGESAREGLDIVLDRLRAVEDPVARNAAAVALFGTQAEDLGEALYAMDLTNAVDQLNGVEGAAQRMFDTLADNDATKIEEAKRNIEVAADGIKGALAAAFSEPIGDLAEFVSENRAEVVGFMLDVANGGLDIGRGVVEGMAAGTEAIGDFVSGPMADLMVSIADAIDAADEWLPGAQDSAAVRDIADGMRDFKDSTTDAADAMRTNLIENGIDPAQQKLNEFGIPQVLQAEFHDASMRAAQSLDQVGYAADGATQLVDAFTVAQDGTVTAGSELEQQLKNAVAALDAEAAAGARAGETQDSLAQKYETGRQALHAQLVQMGLTEEQAWDLVDSYGAVPEKVNTAISSNAGAVTVEVGGLAYKVENLPDGSFTVTATGNAWDAVTTVRQQLDLLDGRRINVNVQYNASGEQITGVGYNSRRMATGGRVTGGIPGQDSVPILAMPDEFVVKATSARKHARLLEAINNDRLPGYANGGQVLATGPTPAPRAVPVGGVTRADLAELADRIVAGMLAGANGVVALHGAAQDRASQYPGRW